MNFKRNGYLSADLANMIISFVFFLLIVLMIPLAYLKSIDPTTEVTFTGVVEIIDDKTMELNTGQDKVQIQLNLGDDTKNFNRMIHTGIKASFYLINHKKNDTFVLEGLTHNVSTGFYSSKKEENVKIIE
jgi:hypothetical protein